MYWTFSIGANLVRIALFLRSADFRKRTFYENLKYLCSLMFHLFHSMGSIQYECVHRYRYFPAAIWDRYRYSRYSEFVAVDLSTRLGMMVEHKLRRKLHSSNHHS